MSGRHLAVVLPVDAGGLPVLGPAVVGPFSGSRAARSFVRRNRRSIDSMLVGYGEVAAWRYWVTEMVTQ